MTACGVRTGGQFLWTLPVHICFFCVKNIIITSSLHLCAPSSYDCRTSREGTDVVVEIKSRVRWTLSNKICFLAYSDHNHCEWPPDWRYTISYNSLVEQDEDRVSARIKQRQRGCNGYDRM